MGCEKTPGIHRRVAGESCGNRTAAASASVGALRSGARGDCGRNDPWIVNSDGVAPKTGYRVANIGPQLVDEAPVGSRWSNHDGKQHRCDTDRCDRHQKLEHSPMHLSQVLTPLSADQWCNLIEAPVPLRRNRPGTLSFRRRDRQPRTEPSAVTCYSSSLSEAARSSTARRMASSRLPSVISARSVRRVTWLR